jgi:hypothetical protein
MHPTAPTLPLEDFMKMPTMRLSLRRIPQVTDWSSVACLRAVAWSAAATLCLIEALPAVAADPHADLPRPPHGTKFTFEVIESHDAKYLGDTPAHVGKDGGLTMRPQVALGDSVYRTEGTVTIVIGTITHVQWDRVSGSLNVEFNPQPFVRIAVGDEVWIDLNPVPKKPDEAAPAAG